MPHMLDQNSVVATTDCHAGGAVFHLVPRLITLTRVVSRPSAIEQSDTKRLYRRLVPHTVFSGTNLIFSCLPIVLAAATHCIMRETLALVLRMLAIRRAVRIHLSAES
jgi:hypothetical protein